MHFSLESNKNLANYRASAINLIKGEDSPTVII